MKLSVAVLMFALLQGFAVTVNISAQDTPGGAQSAESLQAQLDEVRVKEADLNARSQQLDEQLKPENIERSLAGVGSTHPEELREMRRRQLSSEKASVTHQLEQLAARHARLESALQTAETQAYQQSAKGTSTPLNRFVMGSSIGGSRLLLAAVLGCLAVAAIAGLSVAMRRQG